MYKYSCKISNKMYKFLNRIVICNFMIIGEKNIYE